MGMCVALVETSPPLSLGIYLDKAVDPISSTSPIFLSRLHTYIPYETQGAGPFLSWAGPRIHGTGSGFAAKIYIRYIHSTKLQPIEQVPTVFVPFFALFWLSDMPLSKPSITPCLWFNDNGEDAAKFYTSIFPDSEILHISHYTEVSTLIPPSGQ